MIFKITEMILKMWMGSMLEFALKGLIFVSGLKRGVKSKTWG